VPPLTRFSDLHLSDLHIVCFPCSRDKEFALQPGCRRSTGDKHPHTLVTSLSYATKKRPFDSQFQVNAPSPKEMFFPANSCDARHMRE
jgi:hypothetical protein